MTQTVFDHVARVDPAEGHNRALRASLDLLTNWTWLRSRPRQIWQRIIITIVTDFFVLPFMVNKDIIYSALVTKTRTHVQVQDVR